MAKLQYFLQLSHISEGRLGPILGPFNDFIQIHYNTINLGPCCFALGTMSDLRRWTLNKEYCDRTGWVEMPVYDAKPSTVHGLEKPWYEYEWSDITIFAKIVEE